MSESPHERGPLPASDISADVREIRPVSDLKICPDCLVSNSATNQFCTACGKELPATVAAEESPTVVAEPWPATTAGPERTAVGASLPAPLEAAARQTDVGRKRSWWIAAAIIVPVGAAAVFGGLWALELGHANKLGRSLHKTQATLALTQANLAQTKKSLLQASNQSERRRLAIVQTQDVLQKVDPLLSSVDSVQSKAGTLSTQGTVVAGDAESFITTVAALVNYMINNGNDPAYLDYSWIGGQIDTANSQLSTLRADEGLFGSDTSDYGSASSGFGTKATAFTQSVRSLQKQLKTAATTK
jgi:hypothetical protein